MQLSEEKRFYYPQLDGLRFFAFLLVFISHSPFFSGIAISRRLHEYGWIGVDLFLCLSAFLITKLLIAEHEITGKINILHFYIRRILRIWPLYFLFITLLIFYQFINNEWNFDIGLRIVGMAIFSDNILSALLGYNHLFSSVHLWTISYEEQFYVIIPWLIQRLSRTNNRAKSIFVFVVLIILSSIRSLFIISDALHPVIWVLPITHFESILGGMVLGMGLFDKTFKQLNSYLLLFLGMMSLAVVFALPNTHINSRALMLTYPLTGVGMTLLVHWVVYGDKSIIEGFFQQKVIVHLGKISYGLYVYHLLCLTIVNHICMELNINQQSVRYVLVMNGLGLTLTVMFSTASYHIYEKPFLLLKNRFTYIFSRPI